MRARDLKAQGLKPADIGKILGVSRATVCSFGIGSNELAPMCCRALVAYCSDGENRTAGLAART